MRVIGRLLVACLGLVLGVGAPLWNATPAASWPEACVYATVADGIVNTTNTVDGGCDPNPDNECVGGHGNRDSGTLGVFPYAYMACVR